MKLRNKLMILALVAIAALQTACVKPGHDYPDDGLPLGGTVWRAEYYSTSPNGGPLYEEWMLYFEFGGKMIRRYTATDDTETVSEEKIGSYEYKSPEGRYSTERGTETFLVFHKRLTVEGSPLIYNCIKGRD